jgi:hypothetical protein
MNTTPNQWKFLIKKVLTPQNHLFPEFLRNLGKTRIVKLWGTSSGLTSGLNDFKQIIYPFVSQIPQPERSL